MHNYWIGIMALAFVIAMATWLLLVFNADRHGPGRRQESSPQREVIGGEFEATAGGRQLMPHPGQPSEPAPETSPQPSREMSPEPASAQVPEPRAPAAAGQGPAQVPAQSGQNPADMPLHTQTGHDRS